MVAAGQRLSCHAGTASPARTWPTTCIADSLILLNAPTRGVVAAVTSVMAVPVGSGDGREGRGDASGWASGSLSWRRFGNEMRERCNRTRAPRGARRRGYAMRSGGRAVLRRRHRASTRARDAAASFARALPIPRPSAAPNEGDRSARPHRADNRATVTARGVSRRATRARGTRRDVSRVCASAWVRGTHLLRRSGLRGSVCRALRRPQAQEQTRGSRSSVGFRSRIRMAAS